MNAHVKRFPGILLCIAIAIVGYFLGRLLPIVGGPVFGIILGMLIATIRRPAAVFQSGIKFSSKVVLQVSIVLFGATFNLHEVVGTGLWSLPVMLGTLAITLVAAYVIGRMLNTSWILRTLIGVGTAICGASAIAAISGVIDAENPELAYAISTVFLFNIVAVLLFPSIGHLMHLSQQAFGLWAGTAINDTSSVVAAGFAYGHEAAAQAVIVKLTRTTLIIPIVIAFGVNRVLREKRSGSIDWVAIIPWFILWFVAASAANSAGLIPQTWHGGLTTSAVFLIVVALAGVGLCADFKKMRETGPKPLLLGLLLWVIIASSSLAIARAMHLA